jgi:hypothetical protein
LRNFPTTVYTPAMIVAKVLKNNFGSILISVILGLGLAAVFRRVCVGDSCVVVKAPSAKEVDEYVYKIDTSCYKYTPNVIPCPLKK